MAGEQSLQTFLDELASSASTPGGGGAAALLGATGAALVSMVCNLTIGKPKFAEVEAQMRELLAKSEGLRAELTRMMAQDVEVFDNLMAAYGMPRETDEQKAARTAAIQERTKAATLVPLAAARACAEVIALCRPAAELGNPNVISDAGVAVASAQAGLKSAALNVLINLGAIKDEAFAQQHRAELDDIMARHNQLADEVYALVKSRL